MVCTIIDGELSSIGTCFLTNTFGGDTVVIGLVLLLAFAIIMWKTKIPMPVAIALGFVLISGLFFAGLGGEPMFFLFLAGLAVLGIIAGKGLMSLAKTN